jgi:surface antigen
MQAIRHQLDKSESLVQHTRKKFFHIISQRRFVRYGLLTLNVALLGSIIWFVAKSAPTSNSSHRNTALSSDSVDAPTDPLDQLSSAGIAANVARMANLLEVDGVISQADSVDTELSLPAGQTTVISKPLVAVTDLKSRSDITDYVAQAGDTISSIATKFGITSDSIRWSNGLNGDAVSAGTNLTIPPVNGIVYMVKAGDTPDTLAQKYRASKEQIIAYNDAELSGLQVGERIIIPNGQQPAPTSARVAYSFFFGVGYNGYDRGFCTWYVANRRAEIGRPIPAGLGNASTWDNRAPAAGFTVDKTPAYGAAVVTSQKGAGHVAFVEKVNDDGSVWVSEMNSHGQVSMTDTRPAGGWGKVDWKLIPASLAATYNYVH